MLKKKVEKTKRQKSKKALRLSLLLFNLFCFLPFWAADSITVSLTGDIMLDRGVRKRIELNGIDRLFPPAIDSIFRFSDYVIGNLECPATQVKTPAYKKFVFRAEPEWLTSLRKHGFTHLNLANNHSIDQGRRGLQDTYDNILQAGMTPIGAGRDMLEAARPVLIDDSVRPVYILASNRLIPENFAYLPNEFSISQEPFDSLLVRVARLRASEPAAVIIVCMHWGWEHQLHPSLMQQIQARQLVDAGANALVCHHTHTFQTVEQYRGCHIFYSIGNFIFDQYKPLNAKAAVVQLTITNDDIHVKTIPFTIH